MHQNLKIINRSIELISQIQEDIEIIELAYLARMLRHLHLVRDLIRHYKIDGLDEVPRMIEAIEHALCFEKLSSLQVAIQDLRALMDLFEITQRKLNGEEENVA